MAMSKAMIDTTLTIDLDWQQAEAIETICAEEIGRAHV